MDQGRIERIKQRIERNADVAPADARMLLDEAARARAENDELWWLLANICPLVPPDELPMEQLRRLATATRARAQNHIHDASSSVRSQYQ